MTQRNQLRGRDIFINISIKTGRDQSSPINYTHTCRLYPDFIYFTSIVPRLPIPLLIRLTGTTQKVIDTRNLMEISTTESL